MLLMKTRSNLRILKTVSFLSEPWCDQSTSLHWGNSRSQQPLRDEKHQSNAIKVYTSHPHEMCTANVTWKLAFIASFPCFMLRKISPGCKFLSTLWAYMWFGIPMYSAPMNEKYSISTKFNKSMRVLLTWLINERKLN